jgi:hypothetical protein
MPSNGEVNTELGVYRSLCCDVEVVIKKGNPFPDCPNHRNLPTVWKHVGSEQEPAKDRTEAA